MDYVAFDLTVTFVLIIWVMLVVLYISRLVFSHVVSSKKDPVSARYISRKSIHILGGGVVALLVPFIYREPYTPFILSLMLTLMLVFRRKNGRMMEWFQETNNQYEVNFTVMWGISILAGWLLSGSPWFGVLPASFMSFGDGVTGIARTLVSGRRHKGIEGTVAMILTVLPIGAVLGYGGMISGIIGALAEKQKLVDDNIMIPLASLLVLFLFKAFLPQFLKSLY